MLEIVQNVPDLWPNQNCSHGHSHGWRLKFWDTKIKMTWTLPLEIYSGMTIVMEATPGPGSMTFNGTNTHKHIRLWKWEEMGRMFNIFFHCTDSVDCIGLLSVKHPIFHCILVTQINSSNTVKLSVSDKPEKGKHCNVQLQHYHWTGENLLKTNNGSSLGRRKHYCEMFWVGGNTDNVTLFLECKQAQQNFTLNVTPYIIMKQPSTAVSFHYYQQAVKFTVNVTKSPYKAVTFYVCYILR